MDDRITKVYDGFLYESSSFDLVSSLRIVSKTGTLSRTMFFMLKVNVVCVFQIN